MIITTLIDPLVGLINPDNKSTKVDLPELIYQKYQNFVFIDIKAQIIK